MSLPTHPPTNVPPPAPFNRNEHFAEKVKRIQKRWNLNIAIETGTWLGITTRFLSSIFDKVHTVELNPERYALNKEEFKSYDNICDWQGNSGKVIESILQTLDPSDRCFIYLDAHWGNDWPIKNEIKAIAKSCAKNNCVIVIDDFQIPNRKDVPFDSYNNQPLNINFVIDELKTVFPNLYYEYYIPPRGKEKTRGRLIAMPKQWQE